MHLHAVILAGGRGERFWPLSRRDRPKQFLRLIGDRSMLQSTFDRLADWIPLDRQWVVAGGPLIPSIREQVPHLREDRIIVEPVARNTAAAIGAAAAVIESIDPGAVMLILPSDHWIPDRGWFQEDVARAAESAFAIGGLYLFGIPITYPETGYGYLEEGAALPDRLGIARVARFREKPDRERAVSFAGRADMLWNSGIFVWSAQTILDAIAAQMPGVRDSLDGLHAALRGGRGHTTPATRAALDRYFHEAPSESIDYAVLERHEETYVSRARFRWSDVGTWLSWGERLDPDAAGNRGSGTAIITDSRDCVYYAEGGLVALLGVHDLIVVRLKDVTLVCARDRAQDVRRLVREASQREDLKDFF
jgi:mannose-1-phosphate guanylyltransferase